MSDNDGKNDNGAGGPPRKPVMPRALTLAGESQRRARKATVGEVEDGLRNLMRLVKQQLGARDQLIKAQDAVIETFAAAIEELEHAVKELNPGWAGLSDPDTVVLPDGTDPGAAVESAPPGGGYDIAPAPVSDPTVTPTEEPQS